MEREIKFRIKNNDNNWIIFTPFHNGINVNDFKIETLSQYIEKKDKNGKEIYDGDVVKLTTNWISDIAPEREPTTSIEEVVFKEGAFILGRGGFLSNHFIKNGIIEVIGNIYDNPELLKQ